jgi:hypothetical protein
MALVRERRSAQGRQDMALVRQWRGLARAPIRPCCRRPRLSTKGGDPHACVTPCRAPWSEPPQGFGSEGAPHDAGR